MSSKHILILSVFMVLTLIGCVSTAANAVRDADNWVQKNVW